MSLRILAEDEYVVASFSKYLKSPNYIEKVYFSLVVEV